MPLFPKLVLSNTFAIENFLKFYFLKFFLLYLIFCRNDKYQFSPPPPSPRNFDLLIMFSINFHVMDCVMHHPKSGHNSVVCYKDVISKININKRGIKNLSYIAVKKKLS